MRSEDLLMEGRRPVNPLVLGLSVLTCAGIAVYCFLHLKGFTPAPLLGGCLAVAYGLYVLNMARFDTTLRLGATSTDLEEVGDSVRISCAASG